MHIRTLGHWMQQSGAVEPAIPAVLQAVMHAKAAVLLHAHTQLCAGACCSNFQLQHSVHLKVPVREHRHICYIATAVKLEANYTSFDTPAWCRMTRAESPRLLSHMPIVARGAVAGDSSVLT